MWLFRQSTASQEFPLGPFLDSGDGNTQETALTIANTDIKILKAGATAEVSKNSGGATHIANGRYYAVADATDTDTLGSMRISVHVAGALVVWLDCCVLTAEVYDSLIAGSDKLQVDQRELVGDTQSATDLKDFADAGYDPDTNKVQGVVLVDTTTTNTDMRGTDNAASQTSVNDIPTNSEFQAAIDALNQSASRRIILITVQQYERPESGNSTYTIEARTYDGDGAAVAADSTPTLTATGIVSGSLAANLSAATNPATGVYRWTYTVANNATLEQIRFDISAAMSAVTFTLSAYAQVCDFVSATFTTADRALLEDIPTTAEFEARTLVAAAYGTADAGDAMTLTSGERDAIAAALLDLADAIESGITPREAIRAMAAVIVGLIPSGAGSGTEAFKGIGQASGGTTRVTNTVDNDGNRTAQVLNL